MRFCFLILRDVLQPTAELLLYATPVVGKWYYTLGARGSLGRYSAEAVVVRNSI